MSKRLYSIGIFGGAFDPIHFGHLYIAREVKAQLMFDEFRFVPCLNPVHKDSAKASAEQRLQMLNLALAQESAFDIDTREIDRGGDSYSIDTLKSFRKEFPNISICMILGADAFHGISNWRESDKLLEYCHIIVLHRSGWSSSLNDSPFMDTNSCLGSSRESLERSTKGQVIHLPIKEMNISSTIIRQNIHNKMSNRFLLPENVTSYIEDEHIY